MYSRTGQVDRRTGAARGGALLLALSIVGAVVTTQSCAAETVPAAAAASSAAAGPKADDQFEMIVQQVEDEVEADARAAPAVPAALAQRWQSMERDGSGGPLAVIGWIVIAAVVALAAERLPVLAYRQWRRWRIRHQRGGPAIAGLLALLASDIGGVAAFGIAFSVLRGRWLAATESTAFLAMAAFALLIRWRIAVLVVHMVLRPALPMARLVPLSDVAASRLARLLSAILLAALSLITFSRAIEHIGLDAGVAHLISLGIAVCVCALLAVAVLCGRPAAEALIRGDQPAGISGAIRSALARAWVGLALVTIAAVGVLFAFGLSLGLLSYYNAVTSSLGIVLLLVVLEALTARARRALGATEHGARAAHRTIPAALLAMAAIALAWVWIAALDMPAAEAHRAASSIAAAAAILLIAYTIWEIGKLAIDRRLQPPGGIPGLPGDAAGEPAGPATRLQTILPFLRAALAISIAVLAVLTALSRLGVNTAPLIAGASVFGLAISFGSQSLIRDIISGLFYMWDDAFRVGEYIDGGHLKGTVEALGIRSVKLRHQNGPLHTIPYGQLGAVTNLSRDFATIKFNLRLNLGTDIELVRKTIKQISAQVQENPEMAAEILQPLKLQGVADIADNAVVVRLKFTARPGKPSLLQREYLKHLYQAFQEKGITFASGSLTLQSSPAPVTSASVVALPPRTHAT